MTPLCSVLIPSRARVDKLAKCIKSFLLAEPERADFEILIRLDSDDPKLDDYLKLDSLLLPNVFASIGPRAGYDHLSEYYTQLSTESKSYWNMQFNDDATIDGPWLTQLEQVPKEKHFAVCEWHKLGGSAYQFDCGGPFPFLPREFWKLFGAEKIGEPPDKNSIENLMNMGFQPYYLQGVSFHHQRDDEETLEAHRK